MRIIKVISCALLCAFIIICSCLPVFAAGATAPPEPTNPSGSTPPTEPTKPKNYSQMTEAELLTNGQVPIDYIIKTVQKQIDETVKNDKDEEERLYALRKYVYADDGTYKMEDVPVGKFNLVSYLQDKYFILSYRTQDAKDKPTSTIDKKKVYINQIYLFDSNPFLDVKLNDPKKYLPSQPLADGAYFSMYDLIGKPGNSYPVELFSTGKPNTLNQTYSVGYRSSIGFSPSEGISSSDLNTLHSNVRVSSGELVYDLKTSFYMNFSPRNNADMLANFIVTDKDISSEKQYIDDPDRPDGNYKYGIYEFQNDVMTMAQYFEEQPEVIPSKVGSMTNYTTKHKGKSYVWDVAKNTFTDFSADAWNIRTTELFKDYPSTNTVVKFSWKPFDDYDGEIYEDNTVLVDGNGWVSKRPIGSYPYVMKHYINGQVYETFYFMYKPYVSIHDVKMNHQTRTTTANIFVDSEGSAEKPKSDKNQLLWYSKKQDVFFIPYSNMFKVDPLKETYNVNLHYRESGQKTGEYVTFNWDTGAEYEKWFSFNPYDKSDGSDLDQFYEEADDIITDDEGNPVGQGDGSKPGQNKGDGFDFGDFEFNSDSLWKYATEFLNFCAKTFAVLPSFIWQIIATGAVIVVILRILGR